MRQSILLITLAISIQLSGQNKIQLKKVGIMTNLSGIRSEDFIKSNLGYNFTAEFVYKDKEIALSGGFFEYIGTSEYIRYAQVEQRCLELSINQSHFFQSVFIIASDHSNAVGLSFGVDTKIDNSVCLNLKFCISNGLYQNDLDVLSFLGVSYVFK